MAEEEAAEGREAQTKSAGVCVWTVRWPNDVDEGATGVGVKHVDGAGEGDVDA